MSTTAKSKTTIHKILTTGLGLMVVLLLCMSCENDIKTINLLSQVDSLPEEFARDIEVIYSDSGKMQAHLSGPLMIRHEANETTLEFPEGFQVIFYDSVMQPKSEITANYGIIYENKDIMKARNNVIVKNVEKQEQLNTEELIWDRKKGIIYSEVFIKITKPDEVLYGDGLQSDENFDSYVIKNPTGEFNVYPDEENQ
ncbi:MAG: LPS export ABC transporter periplasmic protein LptC [Bacteroidales bacterium]|nr:LPS export ABC transporter periplasmic protein LptC [Bacteroidales bacterium]